MYCIIFVTCPNKRTAGKIANSLLKKKLVACVNIIPKVRSLYWWEDNIVKSSEALMIIKSKVKLFNSIEKEIRRIHPYKIPEIVFLKIDKGSKQYLNWMEETTR